MKRKNYGSNCSFLSGCLCGQSVWILESCIVCADRQPVIFDAIIWGKGQENIERKCISLISVWDCGRVWTFQTSNISMSAGERNLGTGQFLEPFRVPNDVMVSALLFQIVVSRPWKTAGVAPRGTSWLLGNHRPRRLFQLSGAPLRWQCSYEANKRNTSELCQHLGGNWVISVHVYSCLSVYVDNFSLFTVSLGC